MDLTASLAANGIRTYPTFTETITVLADEPVRLDQLARSAHDWTPSSDGNLSRHGCVIRMPTLS